MTSSHEYATFWEHLDDLRQVIMHCLCLIGAGFLVALYFYDTLFHSLCLPLIKGISPSFQLIMTSPGEGLTCTFRLCFWVSLACTSPFCLYRLLYFFLPAFEDGVKNLLLPFLIFSELFLMLGGLFAFYFTIPIANQYLFNFNQTLGMNLWSISHYLDYTLVLLLGNALAFELGVIGFFLVHLGLIDAAQLQAKRKLAIVCSFVIGALLTPPDVLTQIFMALPLIALYESVIFYGKLRFGFRAKKREVPDSL